MKVLIPYSGGVNSVYALWRWLVETDHEIVAVYASEKWDKALERAPREEAAADQIAAWLQDVRAFEYRKIEWPVEYVSNVRPLRSGFVNVWDQGAVEPRYHGYAALLDAEEFGGIVTGYSLENTAVNAYQNLRGIFERPSVNCYLAGSPILETIIPQGKALDFDKVCSTLNGRFEQAEALPSDLAAMIISKCETRCDPLAKDGTAKLCMSCLYLDVAELRTDMSGVEIDTAFAKHGSYGKWRSKADPKTYTYRGNSQIKALELLGIKL